MAIASCADIDSILSLLLYGLTRVQNPLGIEKSLQVAHPLQGGTVFGFHELSFYETYAVFAGGGSTEFQGAFHKQFGEGFGA